jgi:hypothetical protein
MLLWLGQLGQMGRLSCRRPRSGLPRIPLLVRTPFLLHLSTTDPLTGALATAAAAVAGWLPCTEQAGSHTAERAPGVTSLLDSKTQAITTMIHIMVARRLRMSLRSRDSKLGIPSTQMRDIMATMRMSCSSPRAVISLNGAGIRFMLRQMDHRLGRVMALFDEGTRGNGVIVGRGDMGFWTLGFGLGIDGNLGEICNDTRTGWAIFLTMVLV